MRQKQCDRIPGLYKFTYFKKVVPDCQIQQQLLFPK